MSAVRAVKQHDYYPVIEDTARPFRLWDTKNKTHVPHRCYSDSFRAHMGAIGLMILETKAFVIEVYDTRTGEELGQYRRHVDGLRFYPPRISQPIKIRRK